MAKVDWVTALVLFLPVYSDCGNGENGVSPQTGERVAIILRLNRLFVEQPPSISSYY
jgi:hypothetical protein